VSRHGWRYITVDVFLLITAEDAIVAEFVKNFDENASGPADLIVVINAGDHHVTEFVKNFVVNAILIMTQVERSNGTKVYTTSATSRWTPFS
jgi:hypothetical protein